MRKLPIILTAAAALGLTLGAVGATIASPSTPDASSPTPTVTWSAPASLMQALELPDATEQYAWEIYEHGGGSARVKVDPSRPYQVTFMSATPTYPSWAGADDAVVVGKDGRWYWFAVSYTD